MTVLPVSRPHSLPSFGWLLMPVQLVAVISALLWPLGVGPALVTATALGAIYVLARRRFWASKEGSHAASR